MSYFTTRVELHGANEADYTKLHTEMQKDGFSRTIQKDGQPRYKLPSAEYNSNGDFSANQVLEKAKAAAAKVKNKYAVLVTKSEDGRAYFGLDPA